MQKAALLRMHEASQRFLWAVLWLIVSFFVISVTLVLLCNCIIACSEKCNGDKKEAPSVTVSRFEQDANWAILPRHIVLSSKYNDQILDIHHNSSEKDSENINQTEEERRNVAKGAQWQINKTRIIAAPSISPPSYPNQQPLYLQQGYATSNPTRPGQPAIPAEWQVNTIEVMAAPSISSSPFSIQRSQHPQQGYAIPNPLHFRNLALPAKRQITKEEVMALPVISSSPFPKQRPPYPQQCFVPSNPSQPGELAIDTERQISKVEVMAAPSISPPPYPNQPSMHPQQGYAIPKRSQSDSQLFLLS